MLQSPLSSLCARLAAASVSSSLALFVSCMAGTSCQGLQRSFAPAVPADRQSVATATQGSSGQASIPSIDPACAGTLSESVSCGSAEVKHVEMNRSRDGEAGSPEGLITPEIEKKYVHRVYDAIAPHFSATRFAKWPKVALFLEALKPGSVVVDVGCGNGKYLDLNPNCMYVGCDASAPLVSICAQRGHEVLVADALHLPYRTGFCDAAISIAVLHHLSTEQRRTRAIAELIRVVVPGGKVLITVWAREQEDPALLTKWTPLTTKYMEEWVKGTERNMKRSASNSSLGSIKELGRADMIDDEQTLKIDEDLEEELLVDIDELGLDAEDSAQEPLQQVSGTGDIGGSVCDAQVDNVDDQREYFVPWHLPYHRAEISGASAAAVASGFARKDDKKGAVVYDRYYHVFVKGELEKLASEVSGAVLVDHFFDKSNCHVAEKFYEAAIFAFCLEDQEERGNDAVCNLAVVVKGVYLLVGYHVKGGVKQELQASA